MDPRIPLRPLMIAGVVCAALSGCGAKQPSSACGSAGEPPSSWSDPVTLLDRYDGPSFSELLDVEVDGDRVWFCTGVQGLNVYDAADPANLRFLDRLSPTAGSQTYPRCQHLAVAPDGRVYATNRTSTISRESFIAVVDGSAPDALEELGTVLVDEEVEGVTIHGDLLLAAAHSSLVIYERGSGAALAEVGRVGGLGNAWTVRAAGDRAYVADAGGGLVVVDVSAPTAPEVVSRLELPGAAKDLELVGDRAVVALGAAGVALVSLEDAGAPALIEVEDTPGSALAVAVGGDAVFVSDWNDLRVFTGLLADDLQPVGSEPLPEGRGDESRSLGLAARGDVLFSGNWTELVSYRFHPHRSAPDLNVAPRELLLPRTETGEVSRALLELRNAGTEPLRLDALEFGVPSVSTDEEIAGVVLQPGEVERLTVELAAGVDEPVSTWVNVVSDDPDEARKCVPIEANPVGIGLGDVAPDAAFVGLDGATVRLSTLREEGPVLLAYFATF